MIHLWLHRPPLLHLGLFFAAYVLGCGFAQLLAIVPGTGISIWPPVGLFIATLIRAPKQTWLWWVLAGCLAELLGNSLWFHNPLPVALLIYVGNALAAVAGALLVIRFCGRPVRPETLGEVLALVGLGAGIAPVVSATVGSATLALFGVQSFPAAWTLWWIGDATGVLITAPLAFVVFDGWRAEGPLSFARWAEASVLGLIFFAVAALSLSGYLPFAYIIMPPLLWAAVRFEFKGAAVALTLLVLIAVAFMASGASQFVGDPESQRERQIMLQLFLAISAFSALIVAAISRQHQRALLTLRQSERALSQLVDMVPGHLWRLAPDGEPTFFNKRITDYLGPETTRAQEPGMSRWEMVMATVHPDDAPAFRNALNRSLATGEGFETQYRLRGADGVYRWMSSRAEPLRDQNGEILHWYAISVDIDDETRAQEALRERERELSQLVNMVPVQIRRLAPDGEPTFFNKRLLDFFGLNDLGELDKPGMSRLAAAIGTFVHPDDAASLMETVRRSLASGEPFAIKYRMLRADGAYRWVDGRGEPHRDQSGVILHWYAISVDIHDQVQLYRDIEEREAKIRRLVDSDIIGIVIWDLDGRLVDANDAFLRMVQYDRGDLQAGLRWFAMTPPEWQEVHAREEAEELSKTGKMQAREKEFFRRDGSRVPVLIGAACFEGQSRQGVAYILDLTERKRAEAAQLRAEEALRKASEELAKATQAASLAELSASIAHEVNQPLAAIVANSHACHRWLSADPPNLERAKITAERITRDANSAADVVGRIRALFRQTPNARSSEDVNGVIHEVCRLVADEVAGRNIRIETELKRDLPAVTFDRVQVQQVLLNLIRNGIEAMDGVVDGARALQIRSLCDGPDAIRIEVRDAGIGFANADRVFEPFFTTKPQGMGMGLAICRSIVESHGGRLWAANNDARGATVAFTLPSAGGRAP